MTQQITTSARDAWLSSILDNGFEPYFRLSASFNFQGGGLPSNPTEVNLTALVDVLLHTVMHYRDGGAVMEAIQVIIILNIGRFGMNLTLHVIGATVNHVGNFGIVRVLS